MKKKNVELLGLGCGLFALGSTLVLATLGPNHNVQAQNLAESAGQYVQHYEGSNLAPAIEFAGVTYELLLKENAFPRKDLSDLEHKISQVQSDWEESGSLDNSVYTLEDVGQALYDLESFGYGVPSVLEGVILSGCIVGAGGAIGCVLASRRMRH